MSRYRSAGGLDDPSLVDGDLGFVGMDMRRQAGQLEAGLVSESRNGRMDGYWQPRMGAELLSGALTVDVVPLRLPFWLVDTSGGAAITAADLSGNVVILTVTGHGLDANFQTMTVTGTLTRDGVTPATVGGLFYAGEYEGKASYTDSGDLAEIATPGFNSIYYGGGYWTFYETSGQTWFTAQSGANYPHGLVFSPSGGNTGTPVVTGTDGGNTSWLEVKGLGFATTDPNGIVLVTPTDVDTLTYPLTGADETFTIGGGDDKVLSELTDTAVTDILGSCVFSDPSSSNDEFIIIATNSVAKKVDLDSPYTVTDLPYPATESLAGPVHLVQAFDRVMLFRDGDRPWHWLPQGRPIESASYVSATGVVTVVCRDHGLQINDVVEISAVGFSAVPTTADPNGTQTVTGVTDADTFTFVIATGAGNETYTPNTGKVVADFFTLAPAGVYTQPQSFEIAGDEFGISSGVVRFTVTSNTTIRQGDFIKIFATDVPALTDLVGREYQVTSATATDIYFSAPAGDVTYATAGLASKYIEFGGRFSLSAGFIHQPGAPWGIYFQRRLWVPYFYEPGGTYAVPTYTDRNVRDEIAASDILDCDTLDRLESQFRITGGVADFLVGMHPFYEDALLVLNRNSLHLIVGTQGTLADTVVKELTREIGCLARKSIASQGNSVFFLSDNGVYGVEFIEGYNLRGISEPMSKPVQPLIDRINRDLADVAVGIYFNNRYYLAVPLDTVKGSGDAVGNNSVLVYNMLNRGWESVDTFGEGNFNIIDFHVARAGERNDLYAVNEFGGVHRLESRNDPTDILSFDSLGGDTTHAIDYALVTRGYTLGTQDRKRFTRAQAQMQSDSSASDVDFVFTTEDPDSGAEAVGDLTGLLGAELAPGDSANVRMRLGGLRGYSGKLSISANLLGSAPVGRPRIQAVTVEATVTNRATISQH